MKKFLIISVALVVIIAVAFTVFIKIYITPERVKEFLVPAAEEALNRKVDIGAISISLVKGIGVKDFAIKESDAQTNFLKCKDFLLKFKLLPLLSKQVVIDELTLVSPEVMIERDPKGKYNFEDIGKKEKPAEPEKADAEAAGLPISLLVSNVSFKDSRFSFIDRMKELPNVKGAIVMNLSIKSADEDGIYSEGDIDLKLDELDMQKPPRKKIKDINAVLKYAAQINLKTNDIIIDKADITFRDIPASLKGSISKLKTTPEIDLSVLLPKVKTEDLLKAFSDLVDMKGLDLSGSVAADLKLKGTPKKLETMKADGDVQLDSVRVKYSDIDALLDGSLTFNEQTLNIKLKGTVDKNTAELKGQISNYFKNQDIKLDLYSRQLYLEHLIPGAAKGPAQEAGAEKTAKKKPGEEAEALKLKLRARGEIKIDSAFYKGMEMKNFRTLYTFVNNRLEIEEMTAEAGKGKFSLNSTIDMSRPGYTYKMSSKIESLHAEEIVNAFSPKAKDTVFGVISSDVSLSGAGTVPENVKRNLVGNSNFNITDGKITNAKMANNLALLLGIEELRTILLKEAKGTVNIKNGSAQLESLFSSDDIEMDPKGTIGLNETLDLAFDLKLSPRLTDKAMSSKIATQIKSEEGWGMIPLKISGTFSDPKYTVDVAKAGKRVIEKKIDKTLDKALDKLFKRDKKDVPADGGEQAPAPEEKSPAEEPIKKLFKGLF